MIVDFVVTYEFARFIPPLSLRMTTHLRIARDGASKLIRHEDLWSIASLISSIPVLGSIYERLRVLGGQVSSSVIRAIVSKPERANNKTEQQEANKAREHSKKFIDSLLPDESAEADISVVTDDDAESSVLHSVPIQQCSLAGSAHLDTANSIATMEDEGGPTISRIARIVKQDLIKERDEYEAEAREEIERNKHQQQATKMQEENGPQSAEKKAQSDAVRERSDSIPPAPPAPVDEFPTRDSVPPKGPGQGSMMPVKHVRFADQERERAQSAEDAKIKEKEKEKEKKASKKAKCI
jgi:hypothetical protein